MIEHEAIILLHPNVFIIRGDVAYDKDEEVVAYNAAAVAAKVLELQNQRIADQRAKEAAKESALNKLMALGLTEEEALALGVR
jgi:hypothetical protein